MMEGKHMADEQPSADGLVTAESAVTPPPAPPVATPETHVIADQAAAIDPAAALDPAKAKPKT
jgi:hypothetical protein